VRVGLVTPIYEGVHSNPGSEMITAGIRYLVRQAVRGPEFVQIDMLRDNPAHWAAAQDCDALIICGNPRFSTCATEWWESGIWERLVAAQRSGVRVIDGWAGATHWYDPAATLEEMATRIASHGANAEAMHSAKQIHARITRDRLMQRIYSDAGASSTLLPCSSWWARLDVPWEQAAKRSGTAVVLGTHDMDWPLDCVRACLGRLEGADVISCALSDYERFGAVGVRSTLVSDPAALLRLYSSLDRVLSFRLHAAIPAASVGCAVGMVATDSRPLACEEFGIPSIDIGDLMDREPPFAHARQPDEEDVVEILRSMLC